MNQRSDATNDEQIERLEKRCQELYEGEKRHIQKWQDDRQVIMRMAPGYEYKNRVDDPEYAKALAAIKAALSAPSERATLESLGCGPVDNVPDPALAMNKLFKKMDEQDMATLNWIIKGRAGALLEASAPSATVTSDLEQEKDAMEDQLLSARGTETFLLDLLAQCRTYLLGVGSESVRESLLKKLESI